MKFEIYKERNDGDHIGDIQIWERVDGNRVKHVAQVVFGKNATKEHAKQVYKDLTKVYLTVK